MCNACVDLAGLYVQSVLRPACVNSMNSTINPEHNAAILFTARVLLLPYRETVGADLGICGL